MTVTQVVRTPKMLTSPFLLALAEPTQDAASSSSWVQVARCGSFVSRTYGAFDITAQMLAEMHRNFREVTPEPPTKLVVDYDHLTTQKPLVPGAAAAAGWVTDLQLRDGGTTLWALCEWTPTAAQRIRDREYRYISPSFSTNHVHIDGREVGAALLSIAITNSPFLQGMSGLSLCNVDIMGDVALSERGIPHLEASVKTSHAVISLAEIGQRVMIAPGHARTQDEIGSTFEIAEVVGDGDDAFVSIKDAAGLLHKWFRMTELLPASSTPANPPRPPLQPGQTPVKPGPANEGATGAQDKKSQNKKEAVTMKKSASDQLLTLAQQHAKTHNLSLSAAVIALSRQDQHRALADAYLNESRTMAEPAPAVEPAHPISLTRDPDAGAQLLHLATEIAKERRIDLSAAVKEASRQRPDLGAAWERG